MCGEEENIPQGKTGWRFIKINFKFNICHHIFIGIMILFLCAWLGNWQGERRETKTGFTVSLVVLVMMMSMDGWMDRGS